MNKTFRLVASIFGWKTSISPDTLIREAPIPKDTLDKLAASIAEQDFAMFREIAMTRQAIDKDQPVSSQMLSVAHSLAKDPDYIPQAVAAYQQTANFASPHSNIREQALSAIYKYADELTDAPQKVSAYLQIAQQTTNDTLKQNALSSMFESASLSPKMSDRVIAYGQIALLAVRNSDLQKKATAAIIDQLDAIPENERRIANYKQAVKDFSNKTFEGGILAHQILEGLIKHADKLPTAADRVALNEFINEHSDSFSKVHNQALANILEDIPRFPSVSTQASKYQYVIIWCTNKSELAPRAITGMLDAADKLNDIMESTRYYKLAITHTVPGSELHQRASTSGPYRSGSLSNTGKPDPEKPTNG